MFLYSHFTDYIAHPALISRSAQTANAFSAPAKSLYVHHHSSKEILPKTTHTTSYVFENMKKGGKSNTNSNASLYTTSTSTISSNRPQSAVMSQPRGRGSSATITASRSVSQMPSKRKLWENWYYIQVQLVYYFCG